MKNILLLLSTLLIFSCSVQKRKYQKGYYVDWGKHSNSQKEKKASLAKNHEQKKPAIVSDEAVAVTVAPALTASSDKNVSLSELTRSKLMASRDEPCDILIFRDGTEINGKVLELTPTEIKYKKCEIMDGPTYIARKSEVFMIKYANGTREVFKEETTTTNPPSQQNPRQNNYQGPRQTHPLAVMALVFSILGIFPLTFIGSIAGAIMAHIASKRIAAQPNLYKGEGLATAARIISNVMLSILISIIVIFLLAILLTI